MFLVLMQPYLHIKKFILEYEFEVQVCEEYICNTAGGATSERGQATPPSQCLPIAQH